MSAQQTVTITAPCDRCGAPAEWRGHRDEHDGTRWRHIECPNCERRNP